MPSQILLICLSGFGGDPSFSSRQESPGLMSPSLPLEMHEGDSELGKFKSPRFRTNRVSNITLYIRGAQPVDRGLPVDRRQIPSRSRGVKNFFFFFFLFFNKIKFARDIYAR